MVRYDPGRKEQTRETILRAAGRAIRTSGPEGVSVAALMKEAGLTHGGFYAHFPSKEALVAEAVGFMFSGARRRSSAWTEGLSGRTAFERYVDTYLSPEHRDDPGRGCPLTTLAADAHRAGGEVQAAFDRGLQGLAGMVADQLLLDEFKERRALALSLISEMAGAVALSRATADRALSDDILAAARTSVKARAAQACSWEKAA